MKVIIPVAGVGSRLKPHTHSMPKQLLEIAGKKILNYIIDGVLELEPSEMIFVVGHKKEAIVDFIDTNYKGYNYSFIEQTVRDGDGSAVRLGLKNVKFDEDVLIVFGDTVTDISYKRLLSAVDLPDCIVLGMEVENPSHYGIMNVMDNMDVYEVEEKPVEPKSNLAIIGSYYFKSSNILNDMLNNFYENKITEKGEFRLIQAIRQYIQVRDLSVKAAKVDGWFDCGRPAVVLAANRYFLEKNCSNGISLRDDSVIISPSFVAKTAVVDGSVIGPFASIGEGCVIKNTVVRDSIVGSKSVINNLNLRESLVGSEVVLNAKATKINIGEKSEVDFYVE